MTLPDIKLALVHYAGWEREMLSNLLKISHSLLTHTRTFVPLFTWFHPFDLRGKVKECRNVSVHLCVVRILLIACTHFPSNSQECPFSALSFTEKTMCSSWPEPVVLHVIICMLLLVILNSSLCFLPYFPSFSTILTTHRFHDGTSVLCPLSFFFFSQYSCCFFFLVLDLKVRRDIWDGLLSQDPSLAVRGSSEISHRNTHHLVSHTHTREMFTQK